jgi:hypothetical protein
MFPGGHILEQPDGLEGPGDPQPNNTVRFELRELHLPKPDGPFGARVNSCDQIEHGRLSGSIWPDQAINLSLEDLEG